jgi:hypothetical protein
MKPALAAAVGGASVIGAMALVAGLLSGKRSPRVALSDSAADEEAIARMLASENERGSERLWAELIWSQLRSLGSASIWQHITAGQGYGPQGGARPVSSDKPATAATRAYAARFLAELATVEPARSAALLSSHSSKIGPSPLPSQARRKLASGQPLTRQEQRLRSTSPTPTTSGGAGPAKGHRYVGTVEGVEFWT